jgi:hypothetical protein
MSLAMLTDLSRHFISLVTEDLLASIHTLFPIHSITALDLIDHRSVSLLTSPSGTNL